MASTYSDLKIELIGTGEQSGTWGVTTNTNLGTAIEEAIVGRATANFTTDADLTLTLTDSNATQVARNFILNVTSGVSLTATRDLVVPTIDKPYIIENNTTGGQSILVKTSGGTGVTVPNGKTAMVYANGTNVVPAFSYVDSIAVNTATISGGTINNASIGATTRAAGNFTTLDANGNVVLGDASGDTLTINASTASIPNGLNFDSNTFVIDASNNRIGIGTSSPAVSLAVSSTNAILLPVGTDGQRPTGATGYIRFNSTATKFEGYNGTAWGALGGGATGGGSDEIFWENGQTIASNYTITTSKNAGTFGPVTVNSGVTVTVPSGSVWTVV